MVSPEVFAVADELRILELSQTGGQHIAILISHF